MIKLTKWIGILLLFSLIIIFVISILEIRSNEVLLATQGLSKEERWACEGALQWWENVFMTNIIPTSRILLITGMATLLTPKLLIFAYKFGLRKPIDIIVKQKDPFPYFFEDD